MQDQRPQGWQYWNSNERAPINQQSGNRPDPMALNGKQITFCAFILAFFNLFFIIPNLIFAAQGTQCVTTLVNGIAFPLATWLQVDAYVRIGLLIFLLFIAIVTCINSQLGKNLLMCFICLSFCYLLFIIAWSMVGSFMFWQRLNPAGKCTGGIQIYMHIILTLGFLFVCCFCGMGPFLIRN